MTKAEELDWIYRLRSNIYVYMPKEWLIPMNNALDAAIKALEQEQESMLDKIIDKIMDTGAYEQEVNGKTEFLKGINYCLGVIDKYKAESEDKE